MPDFIPGPDTQYALWLKNFATQCSLNGPVLQLTAAEIAQIEAIASNYQGALDTQEGARAALKQATAEKDTLRGSSSAFVRTWTREFKANPNVPQAVLEALGVLADNTSGPVVPVTQLVVTGCSDGVNQLRWNRATNASGTVFVIEFRHGGESDWNFAGLTTKAKFDHVDQTPGVETFYRIFSSRSGVNSVPCPAAVVYPDDGTGSPQLNVAA